MKTARFVFAAVALALYGCAAQGASDGGEGAAAKAEGAATARPSITFTADWRTVVSGTPTATDQVDVFYDGSRLAQCKAEEGGNEVWAATLEGTLNGQPIPSSPVAGLGATYGGHVILALPTSGDLVLWFEATNKYGCHAYDSAYGANYHVNVAAAPNAPGWLGNAAAVITRDETCGSIDPCDSDRSALDGFVFDTWARQRAAFKKAYFEAWKQGVTDWNDPDTWSILDAEVHWRVVGTDDWTIGYAQIDTHVGNNVRYSFDLGLLDQLQGRARTQKSDCPNVPLTKSADGQYVQYQVELYFSVNGVELRPSAGATFKGTISDYAGLYAVCM